MQTINLNDFYSETQKYIQSVISGQEILVSDNGKLIFELKPLNKKLSRPHGLAEGEITISDDFDDSLPEETLKDFEGR
jgi:antitoxin (DNA-binding transcriptional repressor) of toxin-antitoxin stability system